MFVWLISNTVGATTEAETAYTFEVPQVTPLDFCVVFCEPLFIPLSFFF
jgi:hypothetical protein